jgi:hypothetical protein
VAVLILPYLLIPIGILALALFAGVYQYVNSESRVDQRIAILSLVLSFVLSLLIIAWVVLDRYGVRERLLLAQVQAKGLGRSRLGLGGIRTFVILVLIALAIGIILALGASVMDVLLADDNGSSTSATKVPPTPVITGPTVVSVLTPTPGPAPTAFPSTQKKDSAKGSSFTAKLRQIWYGFKSQWPLLVGVLYVGVVVAAVYVSTIKALSPYFSELNNRVPSPIFLQPTLLLQVVQQEAAGQIGIDPQDMTWQTLKRTDDGGIQLTARHRYDARQIEDFMGRKTQLPMFRTFDIEADCWGRPRNVKVGQEMDA